MNSPETDGDLMVFLVPWSEFFPNEIGQKDQSPNLPSMQFDFPKGTPIEEIRRVIEEAIAKYEQPDDNQTSEHAD